MQRDDRLFSTNDINSLTVMNAATRILTQIERRTAYMLAQTYQVLVMLLSQNTTQSPQTDVTQALFDDILPNINLAHLEQYAFSWQRLVPNHAELKMILGFLIDARHQLTEHVTPNIYEVLGMEDVPAEPVAALPEDNTAKILIRSATQSPQASVFLEQFSHKQITEAMLLDAIQMFEWVYLEQGEVLFRQGDVGDSLCIVISGRLRITVDVNDSPETIAEMGRGEMIGEMAVLSDQPRTATAMAARDSELVRISRDAFQAFSEKYPQIMMRTVGYLVERLRKATRQASYFPVTRTFVLVPLSPDVPLTDLATSLQYVLAASGSALHLHSENLDTLYGEGTLERLENVEAFRTFTHLLDQQEAAHNFLLYQCDATLTAWTRLCLGQADRIVIVGNLDSNPAQSALERDPFLQRFITTGIRHDLILLSSAQQAHQNLTREWLEPRTVERHYHIDVNSSADIERLARHFSGKTTAIALGSGGARGFAHIGALRALQECGIPVDVIGGTSIGSMVASFHALGFDVDTMTDYLTELYRRNSDYTLPLLSLYRGKRVVARMQDIFGEKHIEDLRLDYFAISTNLSRSQKSVHRQGLLWRAVRASISIPGLFPPMLVNGDLHIDGAMLDLVPTSVAADLGEGGTVIGIDLMDKEALQGKYQYAVDESGWRLFFDRILPFRKPRLSAPPLIELLIRATLVNHDDNEKADLMIPMPLAGMSLFEPHNPTELIEIGYRSALEHIKTWQDTGN